MFPDFCRVGSTCLNVFVKSDFYISTSFTYILTSTAASYKVNYVTLKMGRLPIFKLKTSLSLVKLLVNLRSTLPHLILDRQEFKQFLIFLDVSPI